MPTRMSGSTDTDSLATALEQGRSGRYDFMHQNPCLQGDLSNDNLLRNPYLS